MQTNLQEKQKDCKKTLQTLKLCKEITIKSVKKKLATIDVTSPVSSKMGFGEWQASCASDGSFSSPETKSQNALPSVSPWTKLKAPGPSVVPAANE